MEMLAGWPAPISIIGVGGGFLFAAAVGIFFGYYHAPQAASLNAVIFASPIAVIIYIAVKKIYIRNSPGENTGLPGEPG